MQSPRSTAPTYRGLMTATKAAKKGRAVPVKVGKNPAKVTKKTAVPGSAQAEATARVEALRLAQIVNLHIAGYSLADIGESIGATAAEVDRMLTQDAARYVRSQPALRVFVRNWISEKYHGLLEASYDQATDKTSDKQLEFYDRTLRTLAQMQRLHGAEVPTQSEVKLDAAPEMVQSMVEALSKQQGQAYDPTIFDDIVDAEIISDSHDETQRALEESSERVADLQPDDEEF
jgi:hypothetical protein